MSELAKALAAFQAELPTLTKTRTADTGSFSYRYVDLAAVSEAVLPALGRHGLSFSAKPTLDEAGRFVLAYALRHESGEVDTGSYPLPAGTPQQVGSAITYARRYALSAVTGIAAEEDDDGKAAKETRVESRPQKHWDPVQQQTLRDGWEAQIQDAKTLEDLDETTAQIKAATKLSAGEDQISPNTAAHLRVAWAEKRAEINGHGFKIAEGVSAGATVETLPSL